MEKRYAALEPDNKLSRAIHFMDARQRITLWKLEKYEHSIVSEEDKEEVKEEKISAINYVYELFNPEYQELMEEYVIDYMRFDYDSLVIVIKPNKWKNVGI